MKTDPFDGTKINLNNLVQQQTLAQGLMLPHCKHGSAPTSGNSSSRFRGRGMEFEESRIYQPGDEIRNVDWRVTARTGKTHTKLYREERDFPVTLIIDLTASMWFGTVGAYKAVRAAQCAALIAWTAYQQGQRLRTIIITDRKLQLTKASSSKSYVLALLKQLSTHNPSTISFSEKIQDRLAPSLEKLNRQLKGRGIIYICSDFQPLTTEFSKQLHHLRKTQAIVLNFFYDQFETGLPAGQFTFCDTTQRLTLNTADRQFQQQFEEKFLQHNQALTQLSQSIDCQLLHFTNNQEPASVLQNVFNKSATRSATRDTLDNVSS